MYNWNGKIVLITGASSGIGKETAHAVAKKGGIPVLCARSAKKLEDIVQDLQQDQPDASCFPLDVGSTGEVDSVMEMVLKKYQKVDVLINNAGYGKFADFLEMQVTEFEQMMNINYLGMVRCTKAVLPQMLRQGSGHILNVASVAGKLPTARSAGYTASKHAVVGFTGSLRQELKGSGVLVSALCPGPVDTPFFSIADEEGTYFQRVKKFMVSPQQVCREALSIIEQGKKDVIIPRYMGLGVKLFHLFPALAEELAVRVLNLKK